MLDTFWAMTEVSTFTMWVIVALVGSIVWFLKEVVGSPGHAIFFTPFLVFGGLAANYTIGRYIHYFGNDKDSNVVTTAAIGVFGTLIILMICAWIYIKIADWRFKSQKRARSS